MEATVVDLRYHMNEVLKALDRNESVSVLCRGKVKGIIRPAGPVATGKVSTHAFFGSRAAGRPVEDVIDQLRGGRCRAL